MPFTQTLPNATPHKSPEAYQAGILRGVSRTFALTIPELPPALSKVVSNAYLLCRITDTIEDEVSLDARQKRYFAGRFAKVVAGRVPAEQFSDELYPLLSEATIPAERDLIRNAPIIIHLTHTFSPNQRAALERCVEIMAGGMARFQVERHAHGLPDLRHLDAYCYYVAGVVGEMLTELFCDYSSEIALKRQGMLEFAASFGQGLQMTNILKDIWEDRRRGACWLPQDVFRQFGFELEDLSRQPRGEAFARGLERLIAIAHGHLQNALSYSLLIPPREQGLRKFCLWAVGMALLTLRKIRSNPEFTSGNEVKISRRTVVATVLLTNLLVAHDKILRWLFRAAARGLPAAPSHLRVHASEWETTSPKMAFGDAARAQAPSAMKTGDEKTRAHG